MVRGILTLYSVVNDFLIERGYSTINKAKIYVLIIYYFGLITVIRCA